MEERNIRWGELVGGLLIVCCSIALVISFWSRIAEMPLVQFLLFNGVTAALFGVGFYSEHRWRLHTTSQGLLTIASMLVPLNFLAIAAVTTAAAANNPLVLGGEAVSTVLFAALLFFGGRDPGRLRRTRATVGIIVPALVQLLVRRFVDAEVTPGTLWALATAPLACYGICQRLVARARCPQAWLQRGSGQPAVQVSGPDHVCRGAAAGTDAGEIHARPCPRCTRWPARSACWARCRWLPDYSFGADSTAATSPDRAPRARASPCSVPSSRWRAW